jgi:predicted nucleic acid-binding protein
MVKTLVDAGPIITFWNRNDAYHDWAVECFSALRPPAFTTEPVIADALLFHRQFGEISQAPSEANRNRYLRDSFSVAARAIASLMDKYERRMDLADATLVRLSELFDECQVLTTDYTDFSFYRRHGRQIIPVVAPPR